MTTMDSSKTLLGALRSEGDDPALERALFQELFESAPEGIVLLDTDDRVVRVNPEFLRMFGYTREEVIGHRINDLIVDEVLREEASELSRRVVERKPVGKETVRYRKDGSMLHVSILGNPVVLGEGQIGVYGIYRDITDQKLAEETLRQSEEKYRTIIETIEDGYFEVDLQGRFLFFNEALIRILGYSREELGRMSYQDFTTPETAAGVFTEFNRVYESGQPNLGFSWEARTRQGELRSLETSISLVRSRTHVPAGFRGIVRDVTERNRTEAALRESEARYRTMTENTGQLVYDYDVASGKIHWTGAIEKVTGHGPEDFEQVSVDGWAERIHPDDRERALHHLEIAARSGGHYHHEYRFRTRSGRYAHIEDNGSFLTDADGKAYRMIGTMSDVSERRRQESALSHEKELAQVTLHAIGDGVIRTDANGRVEYLNPVAERLTGWTLHEAAGRPIGEVFRVTTEIGREPVPDPVQRCLDHPHGADLESGTLLISRCGREYAVEDSAAPIRNSQGEMIGAVLVFRDVSERRRITQEMAYQAAHDALTGLYNRRKFEQVMSDLLREQRRNGHTHAMFYMDLDQFKIVNDTCGHHAGDELLRQLSVLLSEQLRDSDTLARLGGDEFGLILHKCPVAKARDVAGKIMRLINNFVFSWDDRNFSIGLSIGIVAIDGQNDVAAVLKAADQACYAAKDQGRNRIQLYHPDDGDLRQRHSELAAAAEITDALRDDRFELHYQEITPIAGNDAAPHWEILLRMRDRQGALLMPDTFIPGAERYNMMPAIDRWVVTKVLEGLQRAIKAGNEKPGERYSINLSGSSFSDREFADFIDDELTRTGVPPECLAFEITESSAIVNFRRALIFIKRMRAMGIRIMLDDFGSGLSSFAYLKMLPVDYLKIDGNLIKDITNSDIDYAMVQAIHRVGKVMGIPTVAEHISSEEILEKLRSIGVEFGQGFYFHKPEHWQWNAEPRPAD